ncbi:MAG TPA: proline dehydrogenase family protein [Microterricola sp.]
MLDVAIARAASAEALRAFALDESFKARVLADARLSPIARRIADRYIAGETLDQVFDRLPEVLARGHLASIEYTGESVRAAAVADAETEVFLELARRIQISAVPSTVSFDLSHIGLTVDPELGYRNAVRLAEATAGAGTELIISAEGSARTDLVLDTHARLCRDFEHVGITLQARLHRTPADLAALLQRPGRVRLVKGAFLEPESVAFTRDSSALLDAYLTHANTLITSGHALSIATHDADILDTLLSTHGSALAAPHVEFEMLLGLGTETLDELRAAGLRTREYLIFGTEWWLYVLNRIAENPDRVFQAITDAAG